MAGRATKDAGADAVSAPARRLSTRSGPPEPVEGWNTLVPLLLRRRGGAGPADGALDEVAHQRNLVAVVPQRLRALHRQAARHVGRLLVALPARNGRFHRR